jgi:hypothetical protein
MLAAACVCGTGVDSRQFACKTTAECEAGFHCETQLGICAHDDGGAVAGSGGGVAGGTAGSAGGGTAGGDAGGTAGGAAGGAAGGMSGGTSNPLGAPCSSGSTCDSGLCSDGVCCNSACNNPCDVCNAAGHCVTAPLGMVPAPACNGSYACNGSITGCPSSCASDAGCVSSRCGAGGVCIPKIFTLKEDFNSGFNPSVWSWDTVGVADVNGTLHITTLAGSYAYLGVRSVGRFDLTDSQVRIDVLDPGNPALATLQLLALHVCTYPTPDRCLSIVIHAGPSGVVAGVQLQDGGTYPTLIPFTPIAGVSTVQLREQAGTLYFETRDDGGAWVVVGSAPTPFISDFRDVNLMCIGGSYGLESASSTFTVDNVNQH